MPNLPDLDSDPRDQQPYADDVRFVDPDNPSASSVQAFGESAEDAWLRETSALNRIDGDGASDDDGDGVDTASAYATERVEYTPPPAPPAPEPQTSWRYQAERPQTQAPRHDSWHAEPAPAPMPAPIIPQRPLEDAVWGDSDDSRDDTHDDETQWDDDEPETAEMEAPEPWRDANWQRPPLPRFGPSRDETPDR